MPSLRKIVFANLRKLSIFTMVLILLVSVLLQVLLIQGQARENAQATFLQIEQILQANQEELEAAEADYRDTCLFNAESIAYMIQHHPEIIGDLQEFRKIARMMQVDEIHIFDDTGRIFTGTHPEYYDYTFETGEQIGFFKPMMYDKSLRLCQDITPNTAEGKLVQYSALWSADGKFIVQVGMYPEAVLEVTEKNELSYIFSLLQGSPGVVLYAIDADSGEIMGSTASTDNGKSMAEIGFQASDILRGKKGAHITVNGVDRYCVFAELGSMLLGYTISVDSLYRSIPTYTMVLVLCLAMIALMMVLVVLKFTDHYIIDSIHGTNEKLRAVAGGNLDERVSIQNSLEFSELSSHINDMIRSLLSSTDKMSFVLNRTNMRIGVYEYNDQMKSVRFTEQVPKILHLSMGEQARLFADCDQFRKYMDELRREPVPDAENVFHFTGKKEMYVRLEEIATGSEILGIVVDVTDEIITRRQIEAERDIDLLTGLYNRRGLERHLEKLFGSWNALKHGAMIMLDADGLKEINDAYGHSVGDLYLKSIADQICGFGSAKRLAARQGGDEFVLFLYGYEDAAAVQLDLERMRAVQKNTFINLVDAESLQVRFSFGYVLTKNRWDYREILAEADGYMYATKRVRKGIVAAE